MSAPGSTRVPRTLWVTNDFPPRLGGIEEFVASLVGLLPPESVMVLAPDHPGSAADDERRGYAVRRCGRRLLPSRRLAGEMRAAARAHGAEVVVFGAAWPLGELGEAVALPSFALTHGHEAGLARVGLGPLIARVARRLDGLGVISGYTRDLLAPWAEGGARLYALPPGVDTERFHPDVDGAGVRARHGIDAASPLVVSVGRLVARKGQDVLVEAWPRVRERCPAARLVLAGDGPLAGRLRRRVAALDIADSVTFTGAVPHALIPAYHAAADVFAMPCRSRLGGLDIEGLGIVYLEAQAAGVPVLAGASGGAPEALADGESGLVVDGTDRRVVADALGELLEDPPRRGAMGKAGRAFVEQRFAWPVIAEGFIGILAELAGG